MNLFVLIQKSNSVCLALNTKTSSETSVQDRSGLVKEFCVFGMGRVRRAPSRSCTHEAATGKRSKKEQESAELHLEPLVGGGKEKYIKSSL